MQKERMFYHDEYYLCFPSEIASSMNFHFYMVVFKKLLPVCSSWSIILSTEFTFPRVSQCIVVFLIKIPVRIRIQRVMLAAKCSLDLCLWAVFNDKRFKIVSKKQTRNWDKIETETKFVFVNKLWKSERKRQI